MFRCPLSDGFLRCPCNVEALGDGYTELDGSLIWMKIWFFFFRLKLCLLGVFDVKVF